MTSARRGVLEGRGTALVAFILFSCLAAWPWTSTPSSHVSARDLVHLGGLLFSTFITVSIAYRSPLNADRIAFGAIAVGLLLATAAALAPLGATAMVVVEGAESLMWAVAAGVGLVVLVRGSKNAHTDG
jgi:hypothetical protein